MKKDVIIVDNFYENPLQVREYALKTLDTDFYYPYGNDNWRATKTRKAKDCPFKSSKELIAKLNFITGEEIDEPRWSMDYPEHGSVDDHTPNEGHPNWAGKLIRPAKWNCAFHVKPKTGQKLGDGVHNHVTDIWNSVGENGWVGLIYLNPNAPIDSGLFLWQNKVKEKNYDWMSPAINWKLIDSLGAVFNRLILCRGSAPHSGADGFDNVNEDGRLYQTFFFHTKPGQLKDTLPVRVEINA
jgi:hypothetical protein